MKSEDFIIIGVKVTNAEIIEKLDILRLERGISIRSFIIQSIAEKLKREGYLQGGILAHSKKEPKKLSDIDQLRNSILKISMRKPK